MASVSGAKTFRDPWVALTEDIVLCSWARHFTLDLAMPLHPGVKMGTIDFNILARGTEILAQAIETAYKLQAYGPQDLSIVLDQTRHQSLLSILNFLQMVKSSQHFAPVFRHLLATKQKRLGMSLSSSTRF